MKDVCTDSLVREMREVFTKKRKNFLELSGEEGVCPVVQGREGLPEALHGQRQA